MLDLSLPLIAVVGAGVVVGALVVWRRRGAAAEVAAAPAPAPLASGAATAAASGAATAEAGAAALPPPFDAAEALELCGGDPDLFKTVLADLPKECGDRLVDLRAAVAAGDAAAQKAAAHRMKGTLLLIAARPAAELARRLERAGAAGEVGPASSVDELARALERLFAAIAAAR